VKNEAFEIERERRTPVERTVDVLVAGGGPAGIAAALSAARGGARTLLVERYGYLGGMITGAHVVWVLGVGDGYGPKARGFTRELRERLEPLGAVRNPSEYGDYAVDAEVFKWQAAEMLAEAGADVLLHTLACEPILGDGRVRGVFTESKSGRRAFRAAVVVDCTADADLAVRAGCACDNETHDVTLRVVVEGVDRERAAAFEKEEPERYKKIAAEAAALNGGAMPDRGRHVKGIDVADADALHMAAPVGHVKGIDVADAAALTRAETEIRRGYFAALYHLRAHMPGWETARIADTSRQLGVRQGRRIRGEYTVTNDDLCSSRHFDDGVARLASCMDGYALYKPAGLDYDIPYRCLVPRGVGGLLVAGRCISADYLACNSLRLIVPCFATGQAAGAAAALAAKAGVEPRAVSVDALRAALLRQGVGLGGDEPPAPPAGGPVEIVDS